MPENSDLDHVLGSLRPIWQDMFGGTLVVIDTQDTPTGDGLSEAFEVVPGQWLIGTVSSKIHREAAKAVLQGWAATLVSAMTVEMRTQRLVEQLVAAWNRLGLMHKAALL